MRLKQTTLRLAGAVMIAAAISPWMGGSASAAATDDSDCATRPDGVPATATCVVLDENTGSDPALHGETWAWRDANNDLHVSAFPTDALSGTDPVQLCVQESGPYSADFKCLGSEPTRVFAGSDLVLVIDLDALGITPTDSVFYSIHVNQGGRTTVSSGNGGSVPPPPPPSSPPPSSPAPPPSSPPVTSAPPATTASVAVLPTKVAKTTSTPKTSVEAVSLPKTGGGIPFTALVVISLGLLMAGGSLMLLPGLSTERSGRRRH